MKTLTTLRHLLVIVLFAMAAATASASTGEGEKGRAPRKNKVERTAHAQRKQVAAFVDPTAPLAEMVERVRAGRVQ